MNQFKIKKLVDQAYREAKLSKEEIKSILAEDINKLDYLLQKADQKRTEICGDEVHLRAIIEFSSYCKQNCHYCGLRKDNQQLERYRLRKEEIIKTSQMASELGYQTVVLQSGEDDYPAAEIAEIIKEIKKTTGMAITLSLGERDFDAYKLWREAGADRYLLKHEIASKNLYEKYHPGMSFENRIESLRYLKMLGYQIGSGVIIDLPGQTPDILAEDLLLCQKLELDMIGSGPFIPHQQTPLKGTKTGTVEMTLKFTALSRLLLPLTHIPATTALGTIDDEGRQKALKAGANVVMPNVTDGKYREQYQIYPDKICVNEEAGDCRQCIGSIISSLGRHVSQNKGHSLRK
ncbi:[FeFe] hydrogenase maturation protein HydE [Halanaerobium saccharolyticum subsp. saccharolyticum DSM 6643]|uniref:[FeFe] hydrogenase maturation protein HydE n=1 Tax=Halanaerobium saccharolyticum subsp. saccharolyticum DSM 6643 TaxID=1293054 RepID=M5EGV6_9FIRM|nr:[FeFe] hydrogenase H-cluster radical SAM maturase HydE [Halanaerobium saccharolyticum]CCU80703.1 [FeFe] hydrogenase maturation protein HydE [Halanaerobium saccharolyticum subsp. saccharolyticum DSM 6643]